MTPLKNASVFVNATFSSQGFNCQVHKIYLQYDFYYYL